jgi:hypothetical protein
MKFREITIEEFISDFKKFGTGKEIEDCFSNGYCYHFAQMLDDRFALGEVCYIPVSNHFVYHYAGRIYDITGDCTDKYEKDDVKLWTLYANKEYGSSHFKSLYETCINKNIPID